jgi:hypothetical protein
MESETLNKAIVSRWFTTFWGDSYDSAIVDELAAPTVILQYSMDNPRRGRPAVKSFMGRFREAFPDLHFAKIGDLIADRNIVVVRWQCSGTHTGSAFHDFNIGPLPGASHAKICLSGHTAVMLEDTLITEEAVWSTERKAQMRIITGGLLI